MQISNNPARSPPRGTSDLASPRPNVRRRPGAVPPGPLPRPHNGIPITHTMFTVQYTVTEITFTTRDEEHKKVRKDLARWGGGAARWRWRWRCRPTSTSGTMPRTNAGSSMHNEIDTRSTEARRSHKVESTARQRSILIHTAARIYHKVPSPLSHSAHAAYGTVSALARCTGPPRPDLAQLASIGGGGAA